MHTIKVVGYPNADKLTVELEIDGVKKPVKLHPNCYRANLVPGVTLTHISSVGGQLLKYKTDMLEDDDAIADLAGGNVNV